MLNQLTKEKSFGWMELGGQRGYTSSLTSLWILRLNDIKGCYVSKHHGKTSKESKV